MTPPPPYHGRAVSRAPFGKRGFFHGNRVYYFILFRTGFLGGCVWDDCLIFRSGGVEIHWVFIVSPLSQLLSSFDHQRLSLKSTDLAHRGCKEIFATTGRGPNQTVTQVGCECQAMTKESNNKELRTYLQIFFIILRKLPPRIPLISWSEYPLATRALVRLGSLLASSRPLAIMDTPSKSEPRPM